MNHYSLFSNHYSLRKYVSIAATSWQNGFVYRLNFIMWRVRNFIQLLTIYFLWSSVTSNQDQIFSYSQSAILTYILGSSIIRAFVMSSRSIDAQGEIASGDLNNYLVKPLNYFLNWVSRDIADKSLNVIFSVAEISIVILWLRPPFVFQTNPSTLLLFVVSILLATILYFMFSFIVSMTTFWYYENNGWAQRFLTFVLIESLAGSLFPLDILPQQIAKIFQLLPTAYFIYYPMQIYLGRLDPTQTITGFSITLFWIITLFFIGQTLWRRGLKIYGAFGR